jgi:flagellar hook protein FlgE
MLRSMSSAVTGLKVSQLELDVVANNIANVNTIGYKAANATFEDTLSQQLSGPGSPVSGVIGGINGSQVGLGVQLGSVDVNMTQGALTQTGNPYDIAIQGPGWFQVSSDPTSATATTSYTRAGNFTRDANGDLVTINGKYLIGMNGTTASKITIPADAKSVSIAADGTVTVTPQTGSAVVYKVQLAVFPNDAGLTRAGDNLWTASANSGAPTLGAPGGPGFGSLLPSALEGSNVDLANEFTNMITAQRAFQADSRVITTSDEVLQDLVNMKH